MSAPLLSNQSIRRAPPHTGDFHLVVQDGKSVLISGRGRQSPPLPPPKQSHKDNAWTALGEEAAGLDLVSSNQQITLEPLSQAVTEPSSSQEDCGSGTNLMEFTDPRLMSPGQLQQARDSINNNESVAELTFPSQGTVSSIWLTLGLTYTD